MKRITSLISILLLLTVFAGTVKGLDKEKLHQLNHDIVLLNLVNGLHLTSEQMEMIIDKIVEAESSRNQFWEAIDQHNREFERVLKDLREALMAEGEITQELKRRVHMMKEVQHRLEDERGAKLAALEDEIRGILNENQLITIDTYKPCTIPPAQGKIGQSVETAADGIARQLSRIRRIPNDRYELVKDMLVDRHIERIERFHGFEDPDETEKVRQQMLDAFEQARTLSDQEFLVQKGAIARTLIPEEVKIRKMRKNQLTRVGMFMLDPLLVPILKEKMKQA